MVPERRRSPSRTYVATGRNHGEPSQLADDLGVPLVTTDASLSIVAANGELIEAP